MEQKPQQEKEESLKLACRVTCCVTQEPLALALGEVRTASVSSQTLGTAPQGLLPRNCGSEGFL